MGYCDLSLNRCTGHFYFLSNSETPLVILIYNIYIFCLTVFQFIFTSKSFTVTDPCNVGCALEPTSRMREACWELGVVVHWSFCCMSDTELEQARGEGSMGLNAGAGLAWKSDTLKRSSRWWNSPSPEGEKNVCRNITEHHWKDYLYYYLYCLIYCFNVCMYSYVSSLRRCSLKPFLSRLDGLSAPGSERQRWARGATPKTTNTCG